MKSIKITAIAICFASLSSCSWWQKDWYDTISIINSTDKDVELITYFSGGERKTDSTFQIQSFRYMLSPNDIYEIFNQDGEDPHLLDSISLLRRPDSCHIVFDSERKLVYYLCESITSCDTTKKNILLLDYSYEIVCPRKHGCDYTYTITEEDYLNAEPIR